MKNVTLIDNAHEVNFSNLDSMSDTISEIEEMEIDCNNLSLLQIDIWEKT